ncbi:undecaprenyl-phosphate glucose phosphotransferase [Duganella sp. P38]|uniref:undecaprenyl-phosphate glucose phosphotransferase n=1 Tax=Duganella sp. P38 TaxID=3423949 RepID=UPI003D7A5C22
MTITDIPLISFFQRVLDPLVIMAALYLSALFLGTPFTGYLLVLMVMAFFISTSAFEYIDPYRNWRAGNTVGYVRNVFLGWALTVAILVVLGVCTGFDGNYDRRLFWVWVGVTPFMLLGAHVAAGSLNGTHEHATGARSVVLIGANNLSLRFARTVEQQPKLMMTVRGYFDDRAEDRWPADMRHPMLGGMGDIAAYVREHSVNMVFISQPISAQPRILKLLEELQDTTASVYFLPDIYVFDLVQARFDSVGGMPVIGICESPFTGINALIKRASDLVLGALAVICLLPVMIPVALAVKLSSPGPIIFKQRRYGLNGEEIYVYKFRSMTVTENGDKVVQATKNDQRVTRVGGFLRRSSLDELPQFFNVLQGRMSVVGPRPHAVAHNEQYRKLIKGYMLRHKVKPGITGWAQVHGLRGETETLEKMEARVHYDLEYLRNWSLWLDLWIIARTVLVVLKRENAH